MRPSYPILILSLCFIAQTHALNKQPQQQPLEYTPPKLTNEEFDQARSGLQTLLDNVPANTVQPLLTTIDGYCNAFEALCAYSCKERYEVQSHGEQQVAYEDESKIQRRGDADTQHNKETVLMNGCSNTNARSVIQADASCRCAGFDMTDRINFALVGGIVSSNIPSGSSEYTEFSSRDIMQSMSTLPDTSTYQTFMTISKSVCTFIDRLSSLTPKPTPPPSTPPPPPKSGGLFGFLSNFVPSLGSPQDLGALIPIFNAIVGNGNYGVKTEVTKPKDTSTPPAPPAPPAPPVDNPASKSNPKDDNGGYFRWLPHIFLETNNKFEHVTTKGGHSQENLIDKDGYIAKITQFQKS